MAFERDGERMTHARCPICGTAPTPAMRPFCSARCANIDLGRWFTEQYAVPVPGAETDQDDGGEAG